MPESLPLCCLTLFRGSCPHINSVARRKSSPVTGLITLGKAGGPDLSWGGGDRGVGMNRGNQAQIIFVCLVNIRLLVRILISLQQNSLHDLIRIERDCWVQSRLRAAPLDAEYEPQTVFTLILSDLLSFLSFDSLLFPSLILLLQLSDSLLGVVQLLGRQDNLLHQFHTNLGSVAPLAQERHHSA